MADVTYLMPFNAFDLDALNIEFDEPFVETISNMQAVVGYEGTMRLTRATGTNFAFEGAPNTDDFKITGGTVNSFELLEDMSTTSVDISGLNIDLTDVAKLIEKKPVEKLFDEFFEGDDTFTGSMMNDGIISGDGNDGIVSGMGDDTIDAGKDDDTIEGGEGDDTIGGGKGDDTAVYQGMRDDFDVVVIDKSTVQVTDLLTEETLDEGADTLTDIEFIQFMDVLLNLDTGGISPVGSEMSETLEGSEFDDILNGLGGDDIINGNAGRDLIDGGEGNDTLDGGDDKDEMFGGLGDDTYIIGKGDKIFENAGEGTDTVQAEGNIKLDDNFENAVLMASEKGKGKVKGNDLDNVITGSADEEKLDGRDGDDTIDGGEGDDRIRGGDGGDILMGGNGEDDLDGGDGGDIFVFDDDGAGDIDTIRDFEIGVDTIDLSGLPNFTGFDAVAANAVDDGKNVILTGMDGGQLVIAKTSFEELSATDFTFAPVIEIIEEISVL